MKFNLEGFSIKKLNIEISLETILRCILIAYLLFVPTTGKEQSKLDIEPEIEIKKQEQVSDNMQRQTKHKTEKKSERRNSTRRITVKSSTATKVGVETFD
jgi:hypothetical protein